MKLSNFISGIVNYALTANNTSIRHVSTNPDKVFNDQQNLVSEAVEKLEANTKCKSLLKIHLTPALAEQLCRKTTSTGGTLWDCIQSGAINFDSSIGVYASDADSYTIFADLFYPIIADYHTGFNPARDVHPLPDYGLDRVDDQLQDLDSEGRYIISTRVRCCRSLQDFQFNSLLTEAQYQLIEEKVTLALVSLEGAAHAGKYYPLQGMSKEVQQRLVDDHFLFKESDRFLQAAQARRFWPIGRGIYHNDAKTFLVWVNEEDHLRIISMQKGGDLRAVYTRLVQGVQEIEKRLPFSRDTTLGYLTFCPTNLGTTIRASVHIKLPKIATRKEEFQRIASKFNLQVRGTSGEHSGNVHGIYDVSNKRRLGLTEFEAVKEMYDGVCKLIEAEQSL